MDSQSELNFEYNKLPQRGGGTPEPPPGLSFFTLNLWGGTPPPYTRPTAPDFIQKTYSGSETKNFLLYCKVIVRTP